jgi:hypothetical protein
MFSTIRGIEGNTHKQGVEGEGEGEGIAMPVRFGSRFKKKEPVRVQVQKLVPV